jgi:hypothetical protein
MEVSSFVRLLGCQESLRVSCFRCCECLEENDLLFWSFFSLEKWKTLLQLNKPQIPHSQLSQNSWPLPQQTQTKKFPHVTFALLKRSLFLIECPDCPQADKLPPPQHNTKNNPTWNYWNQTCDIWIRNSNFMFETFCTFSRLSGGEFWFDCFVLLIHRTFPRGNYVPSLVKHDFYWFRSLSRPSWFKETSKKV